MTALFGRPGQAGDIVHRRQKDHREAEDQDQARQIDRAPTGRPLLNERVLHLHPIQRAIDDPLAIEC